MRFITVCIFCLLPFFLRAQETIILGDPGKSFILLNDGWKYNMTDLPDAAMPGFDDSRWKPIRPGADIHDSIPADAKTGIGWMRLRIRPTEGAINHRLALMVRQSVASEIYLNGKLLESFGTIDSKERKIKAYDPHWKPLYLPLSDSSIQILAVRFAVQPGIRYISFYGVTNPMFSAMVREEGAAIEKFKEIFMRPWLDLFMVGIMFMGFILHMAFFIMYPAQKANLYFSLALFLNLTGSLVHNYYYYGAAQDQKFQFGLIASVIYFSGQLLMLASIQNYLAIRKRLLLWITTAYCCISLAIGALWYKKGFELMLGNTPLLIYLMIVVLSLIAWRKGMRQALILIIGFLVALMSFFIFLSNVVPSRVDHLLSPFLNPLSFFFLLYIIAPPAAVSIFLAYDFARTSRSLQQKLNEVAALSEKNIAVEKEKQEILSSQNQQLETMVEERTSELNKSLNELKQTQVQLIQSEKMASLGELTAGIAHEIQNPLNFINNFSEVNAELIDELQEELNKGSVSEAALIAKNLKENEEKINHHGKRADGIVKSMLQHTGSTSGQKELTDVNKLVEEYARLAYHGFRARQKDFDVAMEFNPANEVASASMVSQEIGRVVVNILNNAFYAVSERSTKENGLYSPKVKISTRKDNEKVFVHIEDNGGGIPQSILQKIFQPFFTTKPTGQATGLGLSLSYDIVKAHGGEIIINNITGEGAEFVISFSAQEK